MKTSQTKFKETELGQIPEDWEVSSIEKYCDLISSGGTPARDENAFWQDGTIDWLKTKELNDGNIYTTEEKITDTGLKKSAAKVFPADSVVMAMYGATVGKLGIIKSPMTTNQACCVMVPSKNCDYRYLYYQLLINRDEIISRANGAAQQNLNVGKIAAFLLPFPPIDAQQKIAEVLGALDEKIELNRKMSKTLESLAQAVFKKWFIDDSDPNWETKKLGDFFIVKTGKKDANFSSENGQYPFFTCSQGHLMADDYSFDCSALLLAGNGDFNIKWYEGKFEAYQRTYVLEPHSKDLLGFLYFAMRYHLDDITAGHRGSVINFLTKGMIENYEINIPDISELNERSKIFKTIIGQMDFTTRQIETLSQIRDSLLPRLMSGKLRIK